MTNTATALQPTGYICKTCGAPSPVGIGYASASPVALVPATDCGGYHSGDKVTF